MVRKTVAELLVDVLVDAGVERAYGFTGNSLNGITDLMSTRNDIGWVGVRHEKGFLLPLAPMPLSPRHWRYAESWVLPEK